MVGAVRTMPVRFTLLGGLSTSVGDAELPGLPRRLHGLAAALLLEPGPHPRDRLAARIRPDLPLPAARRRLSHLLWVLRAALPQLVIVSDASSVAVAADVRWTDVEAFRHAAAGADPAAWATACDLYAGDLLPGCDAAWLVGLRDELRQELVALVHRVCPLLLADGDADLARRMARQGHSVAPLDEASARYLMAAYQALGQRGLAVGVYDDVRTALARAGLSPEPETVELLQTIRGFQGSHMPPHGDPRSPSPTPKQRARAAVDRGDLPAARSAVDDLRGMDDGATAAVQLLEADLAVAAGEDGFAAGLLEHCDHYEARLREAAMARRHGDLDRAWSIAVSTAVETAAQGDDAGRSAALTELAWTASARGDSATALSSADAAVGLAQRASSRRSECRGLLARGGEELRQGHVHRAASSLRASADIASADRMLAEHGEALNLLARIQCSVGALGAAAKAHTASLTRWRELENPGGIAETLLSQARTAARGGQHAHAVEGVKEALETLSPVRNKTGMLLAECQLMLGTIALARCDADAETVLELTQHPVLTKSSRRHGGQRARLAVLRGTALHLAGRHDQALVEMQRGRTLHESRGERLEIPTVLALQALAHLASGAPAMAESCAAEATRLAASGWEEADATPLVRYASGAALQAVGRLSAARRELRMGMAALDRISATAPRGRRTVVAHRDPFCRALVASMPATSA
jgi:DNA-binding SARP family transcriptional activator